MKPDRNTLESLYQVDKLATQAIGDMYGVSHTSVRRWLASYGIPTRPIGRGLVNRGIVEPTGDDLYRMIHQEFRSYQNIAEIYGVDQSAVPHWLVKHGIAKPDLQSSRRKTPLPNPPMSEVSDLYNAGQSLVALAERYGVGYQRIRQWLQQSGVEIRRDGWNGGKRLTCDDGHLVRSTYELRVDNWLSEQGIAHVYEPALPFDHRYHADFLANGWFIEIWGVKNYPRYAKRTAKKLALYQSHDAALIQLPTWSFDNTHRGLWKRNLHRCLQPLLQPIFETL